MSFNDSRSEFAPIQTITINDLLRGDSKTAKQIYRAAADDGFFYLDFQKGQAVRDSNLLDDIPAVFQLSKELFALPLDKKSEYDIDQLGQLKITGYKPAGRNEGISRGRKDGFEAYLVPTNDLIRGGQTLTAPPIIISHINFLQELVAKLHGIGLEILKLLGAEISEVSTILESSHELLKPSTSALGLLRYLPLVSEESQLGHSAHTDVGSITILFCQGPGLQVFHPSRGKWQNVEVKEGHAIVNIGDCLRFLTGQRLLSCLHRVVPLPDGASGDRYSWAYFLRPTYDTVFVDDSGKTWKSLDWHVKKYKAFRGAFDDQLKDSTLTGKDGYLGLWEETNPAHD